jgi:hypothetical protein
MIGVVLATICFLACAFYLYVLSQWMKDKEHKTTGRSAGDCEVGTRPEEKRPQIAASNRPAEQEDRGSLGSRQASKETRPLRAGCHECERIAYERIAASLRAGHRG